jgi:REP element-mobilizing transposase RayT
MAKQLRLNLDKGTRGGRRSGSGRKRIHSKGVAHRSREEVTKRTPVHVNFKYKTHIRNKTCLKLLKRAIVNARSYGLRVIHFSMQHNHIHLILEPSSNEILTRGMRSLTITFAKGLKAGKVQIERYHLHVLKSVREAKNAVHYVLFNKQKHEKGICSTIDEYCSIWESKEALELIKFMAKKLKMTLIIKGRETWELDESKTYFLK